METSPYFRTSCSVTAAKILEMASENEDTSSIIVGSLKRVHPPRFSDYEQGNLDNGLQSTQSPVKKKHLEQSTTSPVKSRTPTKNTSPTKRKMSKEERLRTPDKKLGGLTEEEVKKMLLPDHLAPNLDIIFVGINPGLASAYRGHHYCGNNNHFWPLLYESGLVNERLSWETDYKCLQWNIGMTNIVARTTRCAAELSRKEISDGIESIHEMVRTLKPLVICFNGKGIYEIFSGQKKCTVGVQANIEDAAVYVMPSTSGLVAQYPRKEDKLVFFQQLRHLRDHAKKQRIDDHVGVPPNL